MKLDHTITDRSFGRLAAIGPAFDTFDGRRRRWLVVAKCQCGAVVVIRTDGNAESCGCLQRESAVALGKNRNGERATNYVDGRTKTQLYGQWKSMMNRCYRPADISYPNYGARGIVVCEAWHDFATYRAWAISAGYKPGLEIDREKNDGNYEPGNCRWVTRVVNGRNRRTNVNLTAFGETKCITEWAEDARAAASEATIRKRIENGWPAEKAISTKARKLTFTAA